MSTLLYSPKPLVRGRWREILASEGAALIEVDPGREDQLRQTEIQGIEVVLVHLPFAEPERTQRVAHVLEKYSRAKLIAFSDVPGEDEGISLLKLGFAGYCNTYIAPALLVKAVQVVRGGEVWAGRRLIDKLILGLAKSSGMAPDARPRTAPIFENLTEREREITLLVASGASNKRIAQKLDIAERTVKSHLSSIFRKTGAHDRLQLALAVSEQAGSV